MSSLFGNVDTFIPKIPLFNNDAWVVEMAGPRVRLSTSTKTFSSKSFVWSPAPPTRVGVRLSIPAIIGTGISPYGRGCFSISLRSHGKAFRFPHASKAVCSLISTQEKRPSYDGLFFQCVEMAGIEPACK